jgi:MFS transporter, FSR family, fosmidomycin resistance protein
MKLFAGWYAEHLVAMTRKARSGWRVVAIAGLAHVLHDGYAAMLYLLLPFWQSELALSLAAIGVLKTVYSGAMAAGQVPAGRLGERFGERIPLFAGTLVSAAAVFALHTASGPLGLGLLLVAGGLGASVQHPLASTLIARAYDGRALRTTLGTYNFAGDLGKVAIPGLLTLLIAGFGWRIGTEALGLVGVVIAPILLARLVPKGERVTREGPQPSRNEGMLRPEPIRRRGFAALSAVGMLDSATRAGLLTFLPFALAGKGAHAATVGIALSLIFAGGACGKFACGALATRIGILRTVVLTEVGTALGIVVLLLMPLSACLFLMPVLGVALNGTSSVLYGTVPELAANGRQARAFGFFYTVTIGADAIAPTFYGVVGDAFSLAATLMAVAMVNLLILPLLPVLRPALLGNGKVRLAG